MHKPKVAEIYHSFCLLVLLMRCMINSWKCIDKFSRCFLKPLECTRPFWSLPTSRFSIYHLVLWWLEIYFSVPNMMNAFGDEASQSEIWVEEMVNSHWDNSMNSMVFAWNMHVCTHTHTHAHTHTHTHSLVSIPEVRVRLQVHCIINWCKDNWSFMFPYLACVAILWNGITIRCQ